MRKTGMIARRGRDWLRTWRSGVRTSRLVLRALAAGDHGSWAAGYQSRSAQSYRYDMGPVAAERLGRQHFEALVLRHEKLAHRDDVYVLAAFDAVSGEHLGAFDLSTTRRKDNSWANIGYGIHNRFQGRGFGAEGLRAALGFGFSVLAFHRIEAAIRPDNDPALACAKAAGMEQEGLRRSFWLDDDGWADHEIFVAIAP